MKPWIALYAVLAALTVPGCTIGDFKAMLEDRAANADRIVFASDRAGGARAIYSMDSDGGDVQRLTGGSADCKMPDWSPSKLRILYARENGSDWEIRSMSHDGTDDRPLTTGQNDIWPHWRNDGSRVLFGRYVSDRDSLYSVSPAGTGETVVLADNWDNAAAHSHPNNGGFVFMRQSHDAGNYEIHVSDRYGTLTPLTSDAGESRNPRWSPDGSRIVFQSNRDGDWDIFVMDADGGNEVPLTFNSSDDLSPDWSPDGRRIVFRSDRDGDHDIYVMDADGSDVIQISDEAGSDSVPRWQ